LIVTHESGLNSSSTFYWVGGSGEWSDAVHWSLSSGGTSANAIPTSTDRVIVDDNSFAVGPEETIILDTDASCKTFTWLTEKAGVMLMNGNRLTISSGMVLSSNYFTTLDGGSFEFNGGGTLSLQKGDISKDTLMFTSGNWTIEGELNAARVDVAASSLKLPASSVTIRQLIADENAHIDFNESEILGTELCILDKTSVAADGSTFIIATNSVFGWTSMDFDGWIIVSNIGSLSLFGDNTIDSLNIDGTASLMGANQIHFLEGSPGSIISLAEGRTQHVDELSLMGAAGKLTEIRSLTNLNATIAYDKNEKLCFNYLEVVDIDILSESVFNAGPHSTLLDSDDWLAIECDDVLLADFTVSNTCAHGVTLFHNASVGPATSWEWDFGDDASPSNTSEDLDGSHQYLTAGSYQVTLTISNAERSETYVRQIQILPNENTNSIVQNGHVLASALSANTYQWYLNDEPIAGATNRTFVFDVPGSYQLFTTHDDCNYFTTPFIILDAAEFVHRTFTVYPNPALDKIRIQFKESRAIHQIAMINAMGQAVIEKQVSGKEEAEINVAGFSPGIYIVEVDGARQKLVIRR
jgi:PKD repeat protein